MDDYISKPIAMEDLPRNWQACSSPAGSHARTHGPPLVGQVLQGEAGGSS